MRFQDRVCCICNEHKKFLARPNAGQKLYCIQCKAKITKEYGSAYWKPCSFTEFFEKMSKQINPNRKKSDGNWSLLKEQMRQIEKEFPKDENTLKLLATALQGFIVRPPYANQIINGTKKYEFRKICFKNV